MLMPLEQFDYEEHGVGLQDKCEDKQGAGVR